MSRPEPKAHLFAIAPYVGGKSKAADGIIPRKLSSNESPFPPSAASVEAYYAAAETLHRYPDGNAHALKEAISQVHGVSPERLVCGSGSDELIGLLVHAFAGVGDEILMSAHGFLMYKIYAQAAGATVVMAPEKNLKTDVDAVLAAVTPKTRIVFIANPNNPTGSYISAAELACLHAGLPGNVLLVVDAAYAEYAEEADYSDGRSLAEQYDNVVMLRTFSKIYALPALRIGWGIFPAHVADALNRIRGPFNLSTPAILAGAAAIKDQAYVQAARLHNTEWREWLTEEIEALGVKVHPSIANFVLIEFPASGEKTASAANALLTRVGLIVREVNAYGLPNHLRVTIGTEQDNHEVVAALKAFLS